MKFCCQLFLTNENSINCFLLAFRFSKIFSYFSNKNLLIKILKFVKYHLLKIYSAKYGFIFQKIYGRGNKNSKKKKISTTKYNSWKIIRIKFKKIEKIYGSILFKKKVLDINTISLWETFLKFSSLLPSNLLMSPYYGENVVNYIQENEINNSINYLKKNFFTQFCFSLILKLFINNIFLNMNQSSPDHILSTLTEKILSNLFIILVKIFLVKNLHSFLKIKNCKSNTLGISPCKITKNVLIRSSSMKNWVFNLAQKIFNDSKRKFEFFPYHSYRHSWGSFQPLFLEKMSLILEYRGLKIKRSFKNRIERSNRERSRDLFFFELNSQLTIDATFQGNQSRLINHCCKSNCFTRVLKHGWRDFVLILSRKNLKVLEEMSYDYRINSDDEDEDQIQCNCFCFECKKELIT